MTHATGKDRKRRKARGEENQHGWGRLTGENESAGWLQASAERHSDDGADDSRLVGNHREERVIIKQLNYGAIPPRRS